MLGQLAASTLRIGSEQVVGPRQPPISVPSGGSVVDLEVRDAISAILSVLRTHGLIAS
jgi:hypothetical protein